MQPGWSDRSREKQRRLHACVRRSALPACAMDWGTATQAELALVNEATALASELWEKSKLVSGLTTDPKMFSVMLFRRLWSNHRGYVLLWNNRLQLESDIILRSGIEASICLAANDTLREEFVALMHGDTIATLKGQIKLHRDEGETDLVRDGEGTLRDMQARHPTGVEAVRLNWEALAKAGGVAQLYGWYRMLSGLSSHVTGASVLTGVTSADGREPRLELQRLQRRMHLMMMLGATLQGSMRHAGMIEDREAVESSLSLLTRLDEMSKSWPGAGV